MPDDAVILAFGDSLTYGTGVSREESYPAILGKMTGYKVINKGVPGELSGQGLSRLPDLLDKVRPNLLILCHGGNDILRRRDNGRTKQNLRAMIMAARQRSISVVLVGVPEFALLSMESASFYLELAEEFNLPIEATILPEVESDKALKSDQIHPNAEGYNMLAKAIYHLLEESGAL